MQRGIISNEEGLCVGYKKKKVTVDHLFCEIEWFGQEWHQWQRLLGVVSMMNFGLSRQFLQF